MLIKQEENLEKDLIIIKVHACATENTLKYHCSIFVNIMGNTVIMGLTIGSSLYLNKAKQLKERERSS